MKFTDLTQRSLRDLEKRSTERMAKFERVQSDFDLLQQQIEEKSNYMNTRHYKLLSIQEDLGLIQRNAEWIKHRLNELKEEADTHVKPLERELFYPKSWITM